MKNILVAVDGSAESKRAVEQAAVLAEKFGAAVTLITVVEVSNETAYNELGIAVTGEYIGVREKLIQIKTENSEMMLEPLLDGLRARGIETAGRVEVGGPHPTIAEVAADGGYDLIVMGRRGLNPVKRFFLGSVTKRVVEDAPCPVLIVK